MNNHQRTIAAPYCGRYELLALMGWIAAADLLYVVRPVDAVVVAGIVVVLMLLLAAGVAFPVRDAWKTDVAAVLRQD